MPACGGPTETLPKVAGGVVPRVLTGGKWVAVPRSAVIRTGKRDVVFVANPQMEGVYDMRAVTVGPMGTEGNTEYYPVLSGVEPGQRVVTRGAFLLDAENRLNPGEEPGAGSQKPVDSPPSTLTTETQQHRDHTPTAGGGK
jgi:Cu(I)/Ag(I) efflux system membrane fusion protein